MKPGASAEAEDRLAVRVEELDAALAAGERPPAAEPDSLSPADLATLRAAQESLLRLEQVWPRSVPQATMAPGTEGQADPGSDPPPDFGRFRVLRELGRGGFGVVFLAFDPDLSRQVALKLPLAEAMLDARGRERFVREAKAVAVLDHPNIAPLYEAGEVHGICYMASAYCDGPDLAKWLREHRGRVAPRMAARIVADLADAVRHAHDRGILHRDLKPSNILLEHRSAESGATPADRPAGDEDPTGFTPRIVDFGLARLMDRPAEDATASFAAVGTAPYMAPEQAEGRTVGPAVDIYGLGALLYAMLCGRPPHRGRSDLDTLRRVVADEVVPPRRIRRHVPRDLDAVCLKCLEKDPARRYADAGLLRDDLRRFLAGAPTRARSAGRWGLARRVVLRHRVAIAVVALAALSAVAILAGISVSESRVRAARELAVRHAEEARRSDEAGQRVRYVADLHQARSLIEGNHARRALELLERHRPAPGAIDRREFAWHYLRHRADASRATLTGPAGAVYSVEFSPRGDLLAAACRDGFVRIRKAGSWEPLRSFRADRTEANLATFSPDGTLLATVGDEGTLRLWDVATGRPRFERAAHRGDAVVARFPPDGKTLLTGGRTDGQLVVWDTEGGRELRRIPAHTGRFECATLSPDGKLLATTGHGEIKLWALPGLSPIATFRPITGYLQGAAFSPDGRMLAVAHDNNLSLLEVPGLRVIRMWTGHPEVVYSVAFTPDGRTLLSGGDDHAIRARDVATGASKGIHLGHAGRIWGLAISPDGRTLASAGGDGTVKLWDIEPRPLHDTLVLETAPGGLNFSRDGRRLATIDRAGHVSVREVAPDSGFGPPRPVPPAGGPPSWLRPIAVGIISDDLETVLAVDQDGTVATRDARGWRRLATAEQGRVNYFGLAPDGTRGYIFWLTRQAECWDLPAARPIRVLKGAFTPRTIILDGHRLLTTDEGVDRPVLWDTIRDRAERPVGRIDYRPGALGLSHDGRRLAFADELARPEYRVRMIDPNLLVENPITIVSPALVTSLAFDATDRTLAGGCEDGLVRLWDPDGGEELLTLEGHRGTVTRVRFFPDGRTLATGAVRPDGSTEIFLWRTARP